MSEILRYAVQRKTLFKQQVLKETMKDIEDRICVLLRPIAMYSNL